MQKRIFVTSAFVLGLLAGQGCSKLALSGLCALVFWAIWSQEHSKGRLVGWSMLALSLGFMRAEIDERLWNREPEFKPSKSASLSGTVVESPRKWGKSLVFLFELEQVDAAPVDGITLLVRWSGCEESVETGDRWSFTGRLTKGEMPSFPGGFSQREWLWCQRARGVFLVGRFDSASFLSPPAGWSPRATTARLRQLMQERLGGISDERARALVSGVVFGDTQALPKEVAEMFRRTGTSHLLAASGMNIALLIGILVAFAKACGYGAWRVAPLAIPLVILYAFLAGCAPSITRAAAAGVMTLLAGWLGRRSGAWNSLCLSVWTLLLWEPRQIQDLGFGLSVAAVVGLLAGPKLPESAPKWCQSALMTLSATLLTLPFMWTSFHEISSTFLPANLVLGPLVETLFPLGLLLTLCPIRPLFWLVQALARVSLFLVEALSSLADPVPLAHPPDGALLLLLVAISFWLGAWGTRGRILSPVIAAVALSYSLQTSRSPRVDFGEVLVRQIGSREPFFWLSSEREELLVLSAPWQERRARQAVLAMGCSRTVQVKVLDKGADLELRWGAFRWGKVAPLLAKDLPYLEVRTYGSTYSVKTWRPPDEH